MEIPLVLMIILLALTTTKACQKEATETSKVQISEWTLHTPQTSKHTTKHEHDIQMNPSQSKGLLLGHRPRLNPNLLLQNQ